MCRKEIKERIKQDLVRELSPHRYRHTLGVAAAAHALAQRYGADADKAELAGLLHDSAKELPLKAMQALAARSFTELPPEVKAIGSLLHGYAAATIARERYGITDEEICQAVAHHTTGAAPMSKLEKIIFLADYIEENRDFDGVKALRREAGHNLDKAVLLGFDSTISHLLEQGKTIYIGTVAYRNYLIEEIKSADRE